MDAKRKQTQLYNKQWTNTSSQGQTLALYESQECRGAIAFTEGSLVPTDGAIAVSRPHWTQQRSQVPRELGMTCSDHCARVGI